MPVVADHDARRARLRERLEVAEVPVDALLVTSLVNVRYLTGFSGSNGALLVPSSASDDPLLATDGRYTTQAGSEAPDLALLVARSCAPALAEQAAGLGLLTVGFEPHDVTVELLDQLRRAAPGVRLVPVAREVEELRAVKDDAELALLTEACEITSAAFDELVDAGAWVGRTEQEVAFDLEQRMRALGAEALAFETIVGAGEHAAVPHHSPGHRPLAVGDLVVLDFGARVAGYHADMTRTVVLGEPADWQSEIHTVVRAAQRAGREALTVGTACEAVDAAARDVITEAGFGEAFGHGTGHGVGLEIHEAPALGPGATGRLSARMPVTVEPGVYLPGRGGVRIEDTLVVTDDGPVALTTTSRELRVLR